MEPTRISPESVPADGFRLHDDRYFQRLLDHLPAGAYMCDADGLITYFNEFAVELWGRAPRINDTVDRFCGSFKLYALDGTPIAHENCWMALAIRNNRAYNGEEIVVERPSGERRTVMAHANPIHDDDGRLIGAVNMLVDISDRKAAEESIRNADRAKSAFLATLSHELRNPLAPIRNAVEILKRSGTEETEGQRALGIIERQTDHLRHLVDDLLDINRISANRLELDRMPIRVRDVIAAAVEISGPLLDEAGHALTVSQPEEDVFVDGDAHRLAQALSNLLNNAAIYTPEAGSVAVSAAVDGRDVAVKVRDNGVGIPQHMLGRLFETFTGASMTDPHSNGNLGVGLPLARRVMELHGGSITARSDGEGLGTEFEIRLPTIAPPALPYDDEHRATAGTLTGRRVLVVDDNEDVVESTAMLLELIDVDVRFARSGAEALEIGADFAPQVILLDIGMPGMNGLETAQAMRRQEWGQNARLIAVTGWGQPEDKRRTREAGFDDHLVKPMDPEVLLDLLRPVPV